MKLSKFFNVEVGIGKPLQLFDSSGNKVYSESSIGNWFKREFDSNNNEVYYENSSGDIRDNRPKPVVEMTMAQICEVLGKEVKVVEG